MYCCIIWHFCSISDTKKIEKMQLKALRHLYKDYTSSYEQGRKSMFKHGGGIILGKNIHPVCGMYCAALRAAPFQRDSGVCPPPENFF